MNVKAAKVLKYLKTKCCVTLWPWPFTFKKKKGYLKAKQERIMKTQIISP
jgi:hypothetical protein